MSQKCSVCGNTEDRDVNGANNVKNDAIKKYVNINVNVRSDGAELTPAESIPEGLGEAGSSCL